MDCHASLLDIIFTIDANACAMSPALSFSRTQAVLFGVLAPFGETLRRWDTWSQDLPALLDDYVLGAFLLFGAWAVTRRWPAGPKILAAGWGFTCGLGYYSFFEQLRRYRIGEIDPAQIPSGVILAIKGGALLLAGGALIATIITPAQAPADAHIR